MVRDAKARGSQDPLPARGPAPSQKASHAVLSGGTPLPAEAVVQQNAPYRRRPLLPAPWSVAVPDHPADRWSPHWFLPPAAEVLEVRWCAPAARVAEPRGPFQRPHRRSSGVHRAAREGGNPVDAVLHVGPRAPWPDLLHAVHAPPVRSSPQACAETLRKQQPHQACVQIPRSVPVPCEPQAHRVAALPAKEPGCRARRDGPRFQSTREGRQANSGHSHSSGLDPHQDPGEWHQQGRPSRKAASNPEGSATDQRLPCGNGHRARH